jgi:hypothetical protein
VNSFKVSAASKSLVSHAIECPMAWVFCLLTPACLPVSDQHIELTGRMCLDPKVKKGRPYLVVRLNVQFNLLARQRPYSVGNDMSATFLLQFELNSFLLIGRTTPHKCAVKRSVRTGSEGQIERAAYLINILKLCLLSLRGY